MSKTAKFVLLLFFKNAMKNFVSLMPLRLFVYNYALRIPNSQLKLTPLPTRLAHPPPDPPSIPSSRFSYP
ncbi:MAG: hypothetical protein LBH98_01310, partial [Chitinispirillales bacterium]|nr:hypothetical protein [Chitinispirillales bacterium]